MTTSPPTGLRERKKAKTRAAIRDHAMRLFDEQGYAATTVEQIAEAADVSPSTFFRYFPTKEDTVLADDYDPMILVAFHAQPADVEPVRALRHAIASVAAELGEEDRAAIHDRLRLSVAVPQVRAAALLNMTATMDMLADALARRAGLDQPDFAARTLAGALLGAWMAALFHWEEHPDEDLFAAMDEAMALLEDRFAGQV
jgi:AcrR family transcriptional regulator